MDSQGSERRRSPRYARRMTLRTRFESEGLIELESANIGPGGAYCVSPTDFPEMARLEVTLFLPTEREAEPPSHNPLRIESVVVRSEPAGESRFNIALFFPRLSDDERALLDRYLPTG